MSNEDMPVFDGKHGYAGWERAEYNIDLAKWKERQESKKENSTMTEGNRQPLSQLQQENQRLKAALTQSIELIKIWKGKAIASSGKSKEIIEEIWLEYFENSPDMVVIREVLGKEVGAQL